MEVVAEDLEVAVEEPQEQRRPKGPGRGASEEPLRMILVERKTDCVVLAWDEGLRPSKERPYTYILTKPTQLPSMNRTDLVMNTHDDHPG